jgi:hypothetical protein
LYNDAMCSENFVIDWSFSSWPPCVMMMMILLK